MLLAVLGGPRFADPVPEQQLACRRRRADVDPEQPERFVAESAHRLGETMWFNSKQRAEPYQRLTSLSRIVETLSFSSAG